MANVQPNRVIKFGCRVAVILISSVAPVLAADAPLRLSVKVDPSTIRVGNTATITVAFLDRDFRPVRNDRNRTLRLDTRTTGGKTEGKGDISPRTARISAGVSSYSEIRLTAQTVGTLRVWVGSDGLEPAEALVRVGSTSAGLSRLFVPVLEAQTPDVSFELLPKATEVALSAAPTASLGIVVSRPVAQTRTWKITTNPAIRIRVDDAVTDGYGVISIGPGEAMSRKIILEPSALGSIEVVAKLLPDGGETRAQVSVVAQVAKRILLQMEEERLPSSLTLLPLTIALVDGEGAPLRVLSASHTVELKSTTVGWALGPQSVTFSASKVSQNLTVPLPRLWFGKTLSLIASDLTGELRMSEKQLLVLPALWALILLATVAGMLGGLARLVYREREVDFLPHRVNGHLQRGIALDACFSGLFGILLLLLGDMGLLHQFADQLEHDEIKVAFLLGIAGGFSGIVVLQSFSKWTVGVVSQSLPSNSHTIRTQ